MSDRVYKIVLTIFLVVGILALAWILRDVAMRLHEGKPIQVLAEPTPVPLNLTENETARALAHPVHKGGVKNVADLRRLIQQNPDIAQHYKDAGFDINCSTDEILVFPMWANVSYRTGNGFEYTRHPILLLAGERIIADQCHSVFIRALCANIILLAAKYPQGSTDQPIGTLIPSTDLPPSDFVPPAVSPVIPTPPVPPVPPGLPPTGPEWYPVPCCVVPFAPYAAAPPVSTGEGGSTLEFLGAAVLALAAVCVFRRKGAHD